MARTIAQPSYEPDPLDLEPVETIEDVRRELAGLRTMAHADLEAGSPVRSRLDLLCETLDVADPAYFNLDSEYVPEPFRYRRNIETGPTREWHRETMRLAAMDVRPLDIAKRLGVAKTTVTSILKKRWAKPMIRRYSYELDRQWVRCVATDDFLSTIAHIRRK